MLKPQSADCPANSRLPLDTTPPSENMSLKHLKPIKFYTLATPNGVKVSTFLEDLKNEYDLPYE